MTPEQSVKFEISYNVKQDIQTYVAFSLTDADRNIWIYNDNTMDNLTSGKGDVKVNYQCSLAGLNDIKLKLEITVRDANNQVLAFLPADEIPVIVLNRDDIDEDDESAKDSATGIIQRNGKWSFS